jgi:NAD(P)-dependent dehydrogenase (short-subunit alcohol dehydrogenase family)
VLRVDFVFFENEESAKPYCDSLTTDSCPQTVTRKNLEKQLGMDREKGFPRANIMSQGTVLVHGGCGALGRSMVERFKASGWRVVSVDAVASDKADVSIIIDVRVMMIFVVLCCFMFVCFFLDHTVLLNPVKAKSSFDVQTRKVISEAQAAASGAKYDAVVSAVGGWAGGSAAATDLFAQTDAMCVF